MSGLGVAGLRHLVSSPCIERRLNLRVGGKVLISGIGISRIVGKLLGIIASVLGPRFGISSVCGERGEGRCVSGFSGDRGPSLSGRTSRR